MDSRKALKAKKNLSKRESNKRMQKDLKKLSMNLFYRIVKSYKLITLFNNKLKKKKK